MFLLDNPIQPYAWGSRSSIPQLLGLPETGQPQAELWMGAHPVAPSRLRESSRRLDQWISEDPVHTVGRELSDRFGSKLPFLLKVLAAAEPLSLQAHPSLEQAKAGFDDEEGRGIPRTAPHRNYKDANHKPELLCALTPFDALCGFRETSEIVRLFRTLGCGALSWAIEALEKKPDAEGIREVFARLLSLSADERLRTVNEVVAACSQHPRGEFAGAFGWAVRIARLYPGDAGVVSALMLNLLHLEPGEAIYLPAGNLHAYLDGTGVEIMASSDNVLRGGLTQKHVDVPELLRVLDFTPRHVSPLRPEREGGENVYRTPAPEFRLSVIEPGDQEVSLTSRGPSILLCTEGESTLLYGEMHLSLRRGESVFVPAGEGALKLHGRATLYRATVNDR